MNNIAYYMLVCICISLWTFIGLGLADQAYYHIDIVTQEQR